MLPNYCCVSHPGLSYEPLTGVPCRRELGPFVPGNFKTEVIGNGLSGILRTSQHVTRSLFVQFMEEENRCATFKLSIIRDITGRVSH